MNPVSSEDELPVLDLESEEQLRKELTRFRGRRPSIVRMENSNGDILSIGIGDSFGALKWMKAGDRHFLKIALADTIHSEEGIDFREQGTDTGFRPMYLIHVEKVIEAVICLYTNGRMPDWVSWSSWNPQSNRMETGSSEKQE
jgi:hypothetical protein